MELQHDRTMKWTGRFLDVAHQIAQWSKDPTTKVGAIAVSTSRQILAEGYNGLPRHVFDNDNRMQRPEKYLWTVHAEANLVAHAARNGIKLEGATIYVTHFPCAQCAALLIQAGVRVVVVDKNGKTSMPQEHFDVANRMFLEAGVNTTEVDHGVKHPEVSQTDISSGSGTEAGGSESPPSA
jgi:dCMP deaminase